MSEFHLFVYEPPGAGGLTHLPASGVRIGPGQMHGTLYDLPVVGRVLMLYGDAPVPGEIWRYPADSLPELDRAAGVEAGRLRRVARLVASAEVGENVACWLYVAGPRLARELLPERRVTPA